MNQIIISDVIFYLLLAPNEILLTILIYVKKIKAPHASAKEKKSSPARNPHPAGKRGWWERGEATLRLT